MKPKTPKPALPLPLECFPEGSRRFEIGETEAHGRHCVDFHWKIFETEFPLVEDGGQISEPERDQAKVLGAVGISS